MNRILRFTVLCYAISASAVAAAAGEESPHGNLLLGTAIVEGLIVANAFLASQAPEGYGAFLTLFAPLATTKTASDATNVVGVTGAAAIGLYNALELNEDKYSKSDVFRRNIVIFHAFGGLLFLTEKLTGKRLANESAAVGISRDDGTRLTINYRF